MDRPPPGPPLDRLAVHGIRATGYHGVFEHERRQGQEFVVDVTLGVDTRPAGAEDDLAKTVDFKVFRNAAELPNGRVAALRVPGAGAMTRKEIDDCAPFVAVYGVQNTVDMIDGALARSA